MNTGAIVAVIDITSELCKVVATRPSIDLLTPESQSMFERKKVFLADVDHIVASSYQIP